MDPEELRKFYAGKKVLVTGHTGFKGSWMCQILTGLGARVCGCALEPPEGPSLYRLLSSSPGFPVSGRILDIRDFRALEEFYNETAPEVVFHLAAQPLVRESYKSPLLTYETNVMGTVNLLECIRRRPCVSFLNITTDKVYYNEERPGYAYREDDRLDGYDPYSNSKSCSELVTHSYNSSFLKELGVAVSTARAGNVIGGGDFAADRIIPDAVRAIERGEPLTVRNPGSIRPYQHVLEPVFVYLEIAMRQAGDRSFCGWYNVGPDSSGCVTTGELCDLFCAGYGNNASWTAPGKSDGPHEAGLLMLDNSRIKEVFGWKSVWNIEKTVRKTAEWYRCWAENRAGAAELTRRQISEYSADAVS